MKRGNLLGPLIIRRDVPGLISFVEGYCPMELHISAHTHKKTKPKNKKPTTKNSSSFLPGWQKGLGSSLLYTGRGKKGKKLMVK